MRHPPNSIKLQRKPSAKPRGRAPAVATLARNRRCRRRTCREAGERGREYPAEWLNTPPRSPAASPASPDFAGGGSAPATPRGTKKGSKKFDDATTRVRVFVRVRPAVRKNELGRRPEATRGRPPRYIARAQSCGCSRTRRAAARAQRRRRRAHASSSLTARSRPTLSRRRSTVWSRDGCRRQCWRA